LQHLAVVIFMLSGITG